MENVEKIEKILCKQRENRWNMALTSARERIDKLRKLRTTILAHRQEIYTALANDFRKSNMETELTEIQPLVAEINFYAKRLRKWMKPKRVTTPLMLWGTSSYIHYEAKGLVLIISPWNYPFCLAIWPLVSALAAGNCVVIKPSEITPNTSAILAKLLGAIFPEEQVAVVEGDANTAQLLLKQPFDHIFFTGSPQIGKRVMQAAAPHLTSVTLELGGKSPAIIDQTANLAKAAERILWGKFVNAGQTCVAPDYILIDQRCQQEFLQHAQKILTRFYAETPQQSPDFCRIVNEHHFQRLRDALEKTITQGAKVEIGGDSDAKENYIAPTILSNLSQDATIMQQEIFGPILPVLTFTDIDKAIHTVNAHEKPLALYIFSHDKAATRKILRQTSAGGSCINNVAIHLGNPHLPFGGVNNSGLGSYHGFHGFKAFSHERSVMYQGMFSGLSLVFPPYSQRIHKLVRWITEKFV